MNTKSTSKISSLESGIVESATHIKKLQAQISESERVLNVKPIEVSRQHN
jgi:hypothetical protein